MKQRSVFALLLLALLLLAACARERQEPYFPLSEPTPSGTPPTPTARATREIPPTATPSPSAQPELTPLEVDGRLLQSAAARSGRFWVVAPGGREDGEGTLADPWDIRTALEASRTVEPGDTVYLRGGHYGDGSRIFVKLYGEKDYPIIVRPYPGEWAVIEPNLEIYGRHTWIWGLEITNSGLERHVSPDDRHAGIVVVGQSINLINNVIHNTGHPAIAYWERREEDPGEHGEVYGNIIWGAGLYDATTRSSNSSWKRGSGMYMQNVYGTRLVEQNIVFRNFVNGIKVYAEGESAVNNFQVMDNVMFANGDRQFLAAGRDFPFHGLQFSGNLVWRDRNEDDRSVEIGYFDSDQFDAVVRDNYIVGGKHEQCALSAVHVRDIELRGNTVVSGGCLAVYNPARQVGDVRWDGNHYYLNSSPVFLNKGKPLGFERWQSATGFDAGSTISRGLPPENAVFVRANKYEAGRGYAAVFNWEGRQSQAVDLSGLLEVGQPYRILDAQNFFGPPVVEGVYDGRPVTLPLDLTAAAEVIGQPLPFENAHTPPEFNVFLVLPQGAAAAPGYPYP